MTRTPIGRRLGIIGMGALGIAMLTQVAFCNKNLVATVNPGITKGMATVRAEPENDTAAAPPAHLGGSGDSTLRFTMPVRKTPVLAHHIDSLSRPDFIAYLKQLAYATDPANTDRGYSACGTCGGTDSVDVFIQPDIGMHLWARDSIPATGLIVARVSNYSGGGRDDAKYGWKGSRHAWWVVDKDSTGIYRSRFIERNYGAGPAFFVLKTTQWTFEKCIHSPVYNRPARAKFWSCAQSATYDTSYTALPPARDSYFRFAAYGPFTRPEPAPRPLVTANTWVTCAEGCCIAGP
ncbi:MAG TPA: hypothetical protein VHM30_02610 [Gemmatimonadaceae bacterium]|nr:hypothetical protein [Gemmatimonadaceae bacterium]